jgi:formylglycine-generating enzyme
MKKFSPRIMAAAMLTRIHKATILLSLCAVHCIYCLEMEKIFVAGGKFTMGTNFKPVRNEIVFALEGLDEELLKAESPAHKVFVRDFYISKYEITNEEYCEFLNANKNETDQKWVHYENDSCRIHLIEGGYGFDEKYGRHPVGCVTWYGAVAFCKWQGGRLPTEAEWEYAASGGKLSKGYDFSGINWAYLDDFAIYHDGYTNAEAKVGMRKPNELGIYDMSGNVHEWCADWFDEKYYSKSKKDNPTGPGAGKYKVLRGGGWNYPRSYARVKTRMFANPDIDNRSIGFRIVFNAEKQLTDTIKKPGR